MRAHVDSDFAGIALGGGGEPESGIVLRNGLW